MFQPTDPSLESLYPLRNLLPEALPTEPFGMLTRWMDDAREAGNQPNPTSMNLCTLDADGTPSARIVLCRGVDADRGILTFFTNDGSRKGRAMKADPRVALTFHWDHADRQIRVEGRAVKSSDETSDAYFESRTLAKRLGAWSSDQSRPIESREELIAKVAEVVQRFGIDPQNPPSEEESKGMIPRPPHWGGWHVVAKSVEIWAGEGGRIHDRAVWTRELRETGADNPMEAYEGSEWSATRLQP